MLDEAVVVVVVLLLPVGDQFVGELLVEIDWPRCCCSSILIPSILMGLILVVVVWLPVPLPIEAVGDTELAEVVGEIESGPPLDDDDEARCWCCEYWAPLDPAGVDTS